MYPSIEYKFTINHDSDGELYFEFEAGKNGKFRDNEDLYLRNFIYKY